VAYVSYPEGTLWKADRDGGNPVQLTNPPMDVLLPRWSPDSKQIVFSDMNDQVYGGTIYVVSAEGGSPRKLLPEDHEYQNSPYWSPDGSKIVFNAGPSGADFSGPDYNVRILDLDSRQVTTVPGSASMLGPRWSPDGRYLVSGTEDELHLKIFDFKTQQWSELAQKGLVDSPEWSRDSQYIYFLRVMGGQGVFRIRVKGGEAEKIADLKDWHFTGWFGRWMGLDPTDAPLLLHGIARDDIYALTLEEK
jgi:Tol biopolymer transport system component